MSGHNLTHSEIMFRVLLQREEARPSLTFQKLEAALPKDIRKRIDPDWRAYIRDENLEFDSAFQKAVRKHIPGIYYVIVAAEFLFKVPFHEALSHYLFTEHGDLADCRLDADEVFELARHLFEEVRTRHEHRLPVRPEAEPQAPAVAKSKQSKSPLPQRLHFAPPRRSKAAAQPAPIARVADQQRAQAASEDFTFQRSRWDFVIIFRVEQDWDWAGGLEDAEQFFIGRVVGNEVAHVHVAERAGDARQGEASAAGDADVVAGVLRFLVASINRVIEIGDGLA